MVKTPKYHIIDTGLAAHLAGDTRTGILKSGDRIGRLIDTFVLAQLRPLLRLATPAVTAHHVRDGNQTREIDLLLESAAGQIVGIEIKAASTLELRDARHLAWLRDQIGDTFHQRHRPAHWSHQLPARRTHLGPPHRQPLAVTN